LTHVGDLRARLGLPHRVLTLPSHTGIMPSPMVAGAEISTRVAATGRVC
jgi:hypothetical protein